jgi:cytochrome c peroxidase
MKRGYWITTIALITLCVASWCRSASAQNQGFGPPGGGPGRNQNNNQAGGQSNGQNGSQNGQPNNRRPGGGPVAQLGKAIFFDTNLSSPAGQSCSSCHAPEAGFSNSNSYINNADGTVPGAVQSRFGNRKPMTISYSWFMPDGETTWNRRRQAWEGGFFADGRAETMEEQADGPLMNPNEMNNVLHGTGNSDLVVQKVLKGSYTDLIKQAYGDDALTKSSSVVYLMIRQSVAEYERSREVSPFSSKYDAYVAGQAELTPSEMNGLRLFSGSMTGRLGGPPNYKSAECITCHTISTDVANDGSRRDFFTNWTFANIGVPKNPHNPFYKQISAGQNPKGYNPDGEHYIDYGLGEVMYPKRGLPAGNTGPGNDGRGDFLAVNGEFRVPSLRNVDKRPNASFVKCYMHNGVFKSLKDVVHFYNTRNLTKQGEIVDLTSLNPYANVKGKPNWPLPEVPSPVTLQNPAGRPNSPTARVGNLGLTEQEENDIVAFLKTLSDGYFTPPPRRRPPAPT